MEAHNDSDAHSPSTLPQLSPEIFLALVLPSRSALRGRILSLFRAAPAFSEVAAVMSNLIYF